MKGDFQLLCAPEDSAQTFALGNVERVAGGVELLLQPLRLRREIIIRMHFDPFFQVRIGNVCLRSPFRPDPVHPFRGEHGGDGIEEASVAGDIQHARSESLDLGNIEIVGAGIDAALGSISGPRRAS